MTVAASHKLWYTIFSLSFSSVQNIFYFLISSLIHGLFRNVFLNFQTYWYFLIMTDFYLNYIMIREHSLYDSFRRYWGLLYSSQTYSQYSSMFQVYLKIVYSVILGYTVVCVFTRPKLVNVFFKSPTTVLIFGLLVLLHTRVCVKISHWVWICIFLRLVINFCFQYAVIVLCADKRGIVTCSLIWSPHLHP